MSSRPSERLYYVITDSSTGDLGPFSVRQLQEKLKEGSVYPTDRMRTGLGTNCGTVAEAIAQRESSSTMPGVRPRPINPGPRAQPSTGIPLWLTGAAVAGTLLLVVILALRARPAPASAPMEKPVISATP